MLRTYKGQQIVERRHRDYKQTLKVRPIFLHNDDRVYALTSIIGIALLIFGLIETELRNALGEHELLPGLLPEKPRRQAHRTQRARRLPGTRPHLHARPASSSTASPTPNAASSTYSRSQPPWPEQAPAAA